MQISVLNIVDASLIGVCGWSLLTGETNKKDFDEEVLKTLEIQHKEHVRLGMNCKIGV